MRACDCVCVCARACVRAIACECMRGAHRQGRGEQPMVSGYGRIGYAPRGAARPLASTRWTILGARPCTRMHACAIDLRRQLRPAREGRERTKANECAEHSCVSCGTQRYVRGKAIAAVAAAVRAGAQGGAQGALLLEALRQVHRLRPLGLHEDCSDRRKRNETKRTSPCAKGAPLADGPAHWARLRLGRECARARIDLQTSRE